jgi:hypothetical protein
LDIFGAAKSCWGEMCKRSARALLWIPSMANHVGVLMVMGPWQAASGTLECGNGWSGGHR